MRHLQSESSLWPLICAGPCALIKAVRALKSDSWPGPEQPGFNAEWQNPGRIRRQAEYAERECAGCALSLPGAGWLFAREGGVVRLPRPLAELRRGRQCRGQTAGPGERCDKTKRATSANYERKSEGRQSSLLPFEGRNNCDSRECGICSQ